MAIDTKTQETLKNHTRIKDMRRGGSPEPSCQLPTAPAHTYLMTEEDYIEKEERLIPLTQGKFTIVDKDKYDELMKYNWQVQRIGRYYYAIRTIHLTEPAECIRIMMHQQIMGYPIGRIIDHKNHNTLDNKVVNLRICTHQQNIWNRKVKKENCTSIFKGVNWIKSIKKWYAHIVCDGTNITLGYFINEAEAAKAYDAKALELFGEFAYTNF